MKIRPRFKLRTLFIFTALKTLPFIWSKGLDPYGVEAIERQVEAKMSRSGYGRSSDIFFNRDSNNRGSNVYWARVGRPPETLLIQSRINAKSDKEWLWSETDWHLWCLVTSPFSLSASLLADIELLWKLAFRFV